MIWIAPTAFWLGFILFVILAMHAIRQHRTRLPTSTLHIWIRLALESRTSFRLGRLVVDVPMALQLLFAALLILALAQPLWRAEFEAGKDIILLLDMSASMKARDGEGIRFDRARERALELLEHLGPGQRMALIAMTRTPEIVEPFTNDKGRLQAALSTISPTDGTADLDAGLAFALGLIKDPGERQVVLIGDGAYHGVDEAVVLLNQYVQFLPVGSDVENVGIIQFAYRKNIAPLEGGELLVGLRNFAAESRGVTVRIEIAGVEVMNHNIEVAPGDPISLVIPVPDEIQGVARAFLEPADGLLTDNRAYAVVGQIPAASILLVGEPDAALLAALRSIPHAKVTFHNGVMSEEIGGAYANYDLLVFNRVRPPMLEKGTVLVIGEVSPQGGVRSDGWVEKNRITSWHTGNTLLRALQPRQMWVAQAMRLFPDSETIALVSGAEGPLITLRDSGKIRVVTMGFDLRDDGFAVDSVFPVFLSNLVDSVRPEAGWEPSQRVRAGETYVWRRLYGGRGLKVTGPQGQFWSYPEEMRSVHFQHTEITGIYTFETDRQLQRLSVNLLDAAESQIDINPLVLGRPQTENRETTGLSTFDIWPLLILLGLLVLLIEWLIWLRYY
ncbi:MAG: VWA domain-containing protein [SAR324 cluster bacterium]|nr:VWA domain-containing protein [SAR324 cluster bacterium]